jgi:hypothetical protein
VCADILVVQVFWSILFVGMGIALAAIVGILTSPIDVRNAWHEDSLIVGWAGVGIMAAAYITRPWLRSRFSLRTLLVTATVAAVWLGLIVAVSRKIRNFEL